MEKNIDLKSIILDTLDSNKALDIISIDLKNKSSMADYMIVASGTSSRHIQGLIRTSFGKIKSKWNKKFKN
jgi:ribosome-associated protein